jgi:acetyl-CoA C-acetyltransferase
METEVVIAGAVRTPIGRFGGSLASLTAVELGERAAVGAMQRSGITADQIDQSIFGHARQAGCGPNPGRQVAVRAGLPVERPAFTVNQACLSGMQAIMGAARCIRLGEAEVVLAGGMESMSRVPYLLEGRWGFRMGHKPLEDAMYRDGFTDPLCGQVMGETAETLARRYEISREAQDDYAARSQQRCEAARREKRFRDEIIDIEVPGKKGPSTLVDDEHPRDGVNSRSLARLAPVFDRNGTVTAGNSSGITDGASAVIVLSGAAAERLGVRPMARLVGYRVDGVDPSIMGIGPVPAVRNLLPQTGTALEQVDLIELNEAFAAQVLAVDHELKLPHERLNVNGGAIALGHPIGCSGNRIVVTLLHEMLRRNARTGLATLCVSGGMGGAMLFERPGEWA